MAEKQKNTNFTLVRYDQIGARTYDLPQSIRGEHAYYYTTDVLGIKLVLHIQLTFSYKPDCIYH